MGTTERIDCLQRSVSIFDSMIRKEIEDRNKEEKRLWITLDTHTHDVSAEVMEVSAAKEGSVVVGSAEVSQADVACQERVGVFRGATTAVVPAPAMSTIVVRPPSPSYRLVSVPTPVGFSETQVPPAFAGALSPTYTTLAPTASMVGSLTPTASMALPLGSLTPTGSVALPS